MKLTIERKHLMAGLSAVKPAATSKGTLPILANVALKTKGNKLSLSCTDTDIVLQTKAEATVEEQGACTVNAALLANLVSSFNGANVLLQALTNDLKIVCGESRYKLGTLSVDDMPPVPTLKDPVGITLPQPELRRLLAETSFSQGTDEARQILCSSLLRLNGSVTVAACDGRRVAVEEAPLEGDKTTADLIIPPKTTRELLRLLSYEEPEERAKRAMARVVITSNVVQFDLGETVLTSKLLEGQYPDIAKVIPKDLPTGVPVGRADLLGILQRVSLIADFCALEFSGQTLTVRARGTKDCPGEAVESLLIPKTKDVSLSFNISYLIDALSAIPDDEVTLYVRDAKSPCVMKVKNKSWTCVTMCRTDEAAKKSEDKKEEEPKKEAKK